MAPASSSTALTVGMLLFPDLTQLDLTGPYEVFSRMHQYQGVSGGCHLDAVGPPFRGGSPHLAPAELVRSVVQTRQRVQMERRAIAERVAARLAESVSGEGTPA